MLTGWGGFVRQDFGDGPVVALDVNDEGFPQFIVDTLVGEQVADIEAVAQMLAVERRGSPSRFIAASMPASDAAWSAR